MKKSLIALAVAGTFAAPAFAATSNVDIYGVIKSSYDYINTDAAVGGANPDDDLTRISSNSSRIGFKGSEDLGGGMKAVWQWETGLTTDTSGAATGNRNTFVGLAGGFGTFLVGTHDTPYKLATGSLDVFGDTMGDYNTIMGSTNGTNNFDLRGSNVWAYISPTFSGFHAALARVNANEAGTQGAADGDAWSLAGIYSNGPLFGSLAWEKHENGVAGAGATSDLTAWKLGVGYKFGDAKVGVGYESMDDDAGATVNDRNAWFINGAYAMGPITLKAQYAKAEDGDTAASTGADYWAIGADYALSKRSKVYALYASTDNDAGATYTTGGAGAGGTFAPAAGTSPSTISIGIEHSF
ncbi:MAG: porin [Thiobacillus sp.]|nr:porin [Thiobacillus sp.]